MLIYSMLTSLDGYTEDGHGRFGHRICMPKFAACLAGG